MMLSFLFVCLLAMFAIDGDDQLSAMFHMMKEKKTFNLRILHLILHGLSCVGKTCVKLKLTNQELNQKPAKIEYGELEYPDGARSTLVAEEILRARAPLTALGAMDKPWQLLNFDEEKFSMSKKIIDSAEEPTSSVTTATEQQATEPTQESIAGNDDEAFQLLKQLFENLPKEIKSTDLQDIRNGTLMYLIDSGGQPQFQQFLPSLVSGPSLFLLTFSLAVGLHEECVVRFTHSDGQREQYQTKTTVYNVLQQSLASIRCTCSYQINGDQRVKVQPRVILLGTMKSLVNDDQIAKINECLMPLLKEFGTDFIVPHGSDKVVYPIDSFTGEGILELRQIIQKVADQPVDKYEDSKSYQSPMCEVKLPVPTVALELLLRSQNKKIVTLEQCKKLAAKIKISSIRELEHILWQLHNFTGSIRYYPDDELLKHYVVISPKILYDIPSFLITRTFGFETTLVPHYDVKKRMQTRGIFTMKTLRELWTEQDYDPLLTPDLLVAFLLHLNIIAELDWSVDNTMESDTESELVHTELVTEKDRRKFFMPSALVHCFSSSNEDGDIKDDSALICFEGGYTPNGVFSSVLAHLLNKKQLRDTLWNLDESDDSLRSNQATLVVITKFSEYLLLVTLSVHLKYLEVKIEKESKSGPQDPSHDDCTAILCCIQDAVREVISGLHYNHNADPEQGLFFPCRCSHDKPTPHAVKYKENGSTRCHGHISTPAESWKKKWIKGICVQDQ